MGDEAASSLACSRRGPEKADAASSDSGSRVAPVRFGVTLVMN